MNVSGSPRIVKRAAGFTNGLQEDANLARQTAPTSALKRTTVKGATAILSTTTDTLRGLVRTVTGTHTQTRQSLTNTIGLYAATAKRLTMTDDLIAQRGSVYGPPQVNLGERTARLWTAYLKDLGINRDIDGRDVSSLMILLKIARLQHTADHEDSWNDIGGYAANGLTCSKQCHD